MSGFHGPGAMLLVIAALTVVIGAITAVVARRIGGRRAVVLGLFAWSVACLLVITIVPTTAASAALPPATTCSFDYDGPAPDGFWIVPGGQRLLNGLVFVPAGILLVASCSQFSRGLRWVVPGVVLLAATSVVIEWTQLVTRWGRACDITDVADNITGVLVGTGIGLAGVGMARAVGRLVRPVNQQAG